MMTGVLAMLGKVGPVQLLTLTCEVGWDMVCDGNLRCSLQLYLVPID